MKKIIICLIFTIFFYSFSCDDSIKVYTKEKGLFVIKLKNPQIIPYVSNTLETNKSVFDKTKATLVLNGGYFDPANKKTISFITINKQIVASPLDNENLMNSEELKPYLDKILNRTEFRICENGLFDITPHFEENRRINHAIQAGPMLVPNLKLEEEFFILKKDGKIIRTSTQPFQKCARTAIAIKNNTVYLIIASNEHKMTLPELSEFCKKEKYEKAMALDGGSSTSLNYKNINIASGKNNHSRYLKSFLLVR